MHLRCSSGRCLNSTSTSLAVASLGALLLLSASNSAVGQDTPDYYRANCLNCHTIGDGRLTGPDLKDVGKRKDAEWLIAFMQNPRAVVESGDTYAAKLVEETPGGAIMPTPPGMTRYRAEQILKLIEEESKLEKSNFRKVKVSSKPFTDAQRAAGREIFTGVQKLTNGGAACNACHSMHDLSALGGGQLGPDLTRVFERQKGRVGLTAWLTAPATETMQPIFKDKKLEPDEIEALVAYFEESAKNSEADASVPRIAFLITGLILAAAIVFGFDVLWKARFHAVRRPLVDSVSRRIHQEASDSGN